MSPIGANYYDPALAGAAIVRDRGRELLGRVMGLVAVAVGFAALGAYLGRDLGGMTGLLLFIPAFACIIGLNLAAAKGREQLALGLLFGLGLLLGLAVAPAIAYFAGADPSALWQATGATAAFVAACGSYGYATRRDVSSHAVLGPARADRVRDRRDLRLDSQLSHHRRRRRTRNLRRVHDLRLQPAAPSKRPERRLDRRQHLPRRLQRLPVLAQPVRRRGRVTGCWIGRRGPIPSSGNVVGSSASAPDGARDVTVKTWDGQA